MPEGIVEGVLHTWVKTVSIPASSHIQIYLGFASKTTNLLSSSGTSGIGEYPSATSTYAQYDDGASVFTNYWNFAGTSLPSGLTAVSGTAGTDYKVDNGLQLLTTTARIQSTASISGSYILEMYNQFISNAGSGWDFGIYSSNTSAFGMHADGGGGTTWASTWYYNNGYTEISTSGETIGSGYYFLWQIINNAGSITTNFDSPAYSTYYTASFTNSLSAPITFGERFSNGYTGQSMNDIIYWLRTRAYPPSGVMPSVTFGAVQQAPQITLSISPNPATYGQSITITATCPASTDTCAIDYPSLGTAIATGTGSATYTWNTTKEGIGTFSSFYANDITQGTNSTPQSLTTYIPINIYYANATSSFIHKTLTLSGLFLIPQCTNNAASLSLGYCIGNMIYSTSTTLQGNIYVFGNLTIDSGVTITENGHYMYATGTFDNLGAITGGNNPNAPGGAGASGTGSGSPGTSITTSYAGSGAGGGGGYSGGGPGGSGGSTLAPGGSGGAPGATGSSGSTPSAPSMSQSLATSIFNNIAKYLSSASGGGGGGYDNGGGSGAIGVLGVAIGGNKVIAGTINTNGNVGGGGPADGGGGGGSGAGSILIVYNSSYTAGTYSDAGGAGGAGTNTGGGGSGGNGQVITYPTFIYSPFPSLIHYPIKFNASVASNTINFNVSVINLTTHSKLYSQASNQSFSYLPSQPIGYLLNFKEQQGSQKLNLNISFVLNLTDINSTFNFSTPIQYFPDVRSL